MSKIQDFILAIVKSPWFLRSLGILATIGGIAKTATDAIAANGIPTDLTGLLIMLVGIGQLVSKQWNVTNAKEANVVAQPVPRVDPAVIPTVTIPPVKP